MGKAKKFTLREIVENEDLQDRIEYLKNNTIMWVPGTNRTMDAYVKAKELAEERRIERELRYEEKFKSNPSYKEYFEEFEDKGNIFLYQVRETIKPKNLADFISFVFNPERRNKLKVVDYLLGKIYETMDGM